MAACTELASHFCLFRSFSGTNGEVARLLSGDGERRGERSGDPGDLKEYSVIQLFLFFLCFVYEGIIFVNRSCYGVCKFFRSFLFFLARDHILIRWMTDLRRAKKKENYTRATFYFLEESSAKKKHLLNKQSCGESRESGLLFSGA